MRVEARGVLVTAPEDAWKVVGEPYRLPDRWPDCAGVEPDRTEVAVRVDASPWRIALESLASLPRRAVSRLHDLCQTAAEL